MRWNDLLGLALRSLWQQKLRSALNLAGVLIGTLVLIFVFAAGDGMRHTVDSFLREQDLLRTILITPRYDFGGESEDLPEVLIPSGVDELTKQRLTTRAIQEWRTQSGRWELQRLQGEDIAALRRMPEVESITPRVVQACSGVLDGVSRDTSLEGVSPRNEVLSERVVAGRMLEQAGMKEIVVHEYLAFLWGYCTPQQLESLIGKRIQVKVRLNERDLESIIRYAQLITNSDDREDFASISKLDASALAERGLSFDSISHIIADLQQIPRLMEENGADPASLELIEAVLRQGPGGQSRSAPSEERPNDGTRQQVSVPTEIVFESEVVGIVRGENQDEPFNPFELQWGLSGADLLVHELDAEALYSQTDEMRKQGYTSALVIVKEPADMELVTAEISERGFRPRSLLLFLERFENQLAVARWILVGIVAVVFGTGGLSIANTMVINVIERRYEIGVMKALGASQRKVLGMFLIEGLVLGVLGSTLAFVILLGSSGPLEEAIIGRLNQRLAVEVAGPVIRYPFWLLPMAVGVACAVTTSATLIPAWRASRVDPIITLRLR